MAAALAPLAALVLAANAIAPARAAVPSWPVSTTLVLAEIVTGGTSASDEYVEVYNASANAVSLAGLELVYVTSAGGTITRKASWAEGSSLDAHRHVLVANASGIYASVADLTYSGGFAATGGALVLRPIGGDPIDALAWGDASNAFVEGVAAPAPEPGSSVERLPGGDAGNGADTNDNLADLRLQTVPVPQPLSAAPTPPDGTSSPSPTSTATATPSGEPTAGVTPTASPSDPAATVPATPTPTPASDSPSPSPSASPSPSPSRSPSPSPTPSITPSWSPSASPTETPTAAPLSIATARARPVGSVVSVSGIVTAEAGTYVDTRTIAIQDASAGVAARLVAGSERLVARGDRVLIRGTISDPHGNLTIRIARAGDVVVLERSALPSPRAASSLGESLEGLLVRTEGRVDEVDRSAANTVSVVLEGDIRAAAFRSRRVPIDRLARGQVVQFTGVLAQRRSTTSEGYRIWLRDHGDLMTLGAAPSQPATPSSSPGRGGTPAVPALSIAAARSRTGATVSVAGTVTTKAGLLDADARRVVIQDATGAILVRMPADGRRPALGDRLRSVGTIGTYYAAPQLAATSVTRLGGAASPRPLAVMRAPLAERLEWSLVRSTGTIRSLERRGRAWKLELVVRGGAIPVSADERAAIPSEQLANGLRITVTGLVRRPRSTASDRRFAISPRSAADVVLGRPGSGPERPRASTASGSREQPGRAGSATRGSPAGEAIDIDLDAVAAHAGRKVRVGGELVGRNGTRVTLRDRTGTGRVRLPASAAPLVADLGAGQAVNVTGVVRRSHGVWEVVAGSAADVDIAARLASPGEPAAASPLPDVADTGPSVPASQSTLVTSTGAPTAVGGLLTASALVTAAGLWLRRRGRPDGDPEGHSVP